MKSTLVAPSILAANWCKFEEEIQNVVAAGADWIHLDVMDGHFVPSITFGPQMVEAARRATNTILDVHLMIEAPERQVEAFARAGADIITVHQEACPHLHRTVQQIKSLGKKAGVAINPGTPVATLRDIISSIDLVLVMTVNPGWGGQSYIPHSDIKIKEAADLIGKSEIFLEVDGGITGETAARAKKAGANALVSGTHIFGSKDYRSAIAALRA